MVRNGVVTCMLALFMTAAGAAMARVPQTGPPPQTKVAAGPVVNLNTATEAELQTLPGVGPAMAARIVAYREENGAFKKVEELMNVKGIGEKSFLKLKSQLTVTPPKATER